MQLRPLLACRASHSGNSSPVFAAAAGFIDFEGLVFGSLADCVGADQREWLVFDGSGGSMSTAQAEISAILVDRVADWLAQSALAGNDLETLVKGFCERLAAAGLPLKRVHLSFSML